MSGPSPERARGPRPDPERPSIPGYEIEGVLGRGATGVVYRARQKAVEREVALKVLLPELTGRPRVIRRLQREARTTARLAHPNIVSAIDMGETDGRWWYAMELVEGPSLARRLREEGRLSERQVLRLFIPLCEALVHLWEHGVVHRDIKPANILIDRSGRARLADLGLAFADDDPSLTAQGGTLGTPHYISPEQAIDPTTADVRSDLWSFGATLFHALCGRPPFRGESAAEILSGVLHARIPDPLELEESLSRNLALVVRKCLSREPERRYQTPRELLADLERVRERRAPRIRAASLDPVQHAGGPRRLAVLGVALVALLAAGGYAWLQGLEGGAGAAAEGGAAPPAPYPPLEALARRADERADLPGQLLHELAALRADLPAAHHPRWRELDAALRTELRAAATSVRGDVEREVAAELERRDYQAALETLGDELRRKLLLRSGFPEADLEREGVAIEPWRLALEAGVQDRLELALRDLQTGLERWSERHLLEVDRLQQTGDWRAAHAELFLDDTEILAGAGFAGWRLPDEAVDERLAVYRTELRLRRQALVDAWQLLDLELRRWVDTRTETLTRELRERSLRRGADAELREAFARELAVREVDPERVPEALPFKSAERLEEKARELVQLEDRLLGTELRAELEDVERRSTPHWRNRDYEAALGLWEGARRRLAELPPHVGSAWRPALNDVVRVRITEARLLLDLLHRVAEEIRRRDGETLDLWVGSILHRDRRLRAGPDVLEQGFRLEGLPSPLDVRELASATFESFAAFGDPAGEEPVDRLLHTLFLHHEDRARDARAVLRSGPLPAEGELGDLALELRLRITDSIEQADREARARTADADFYLTWLDDLRQRSPRTALNVLDLLLDDYGDLPRVAGRRDELVAARRRLTDAQERGDEEDFRRLYGPDELSFPRLGRVSLGFVFDRSAVGAWESRDWIFDGVGWRPESRVQEWSGLETQRGPRLALVPPLDVDKGYFELTVEVDQPSRSGPPQLLLLSAAGYHVALVGPGLPGGDQSPRWLAGTGALSQLLERVRDGEGTRVPRLLQEGASHTIFLRGSRGGGRLTLELDGRRLGQPMVVRPDADDRRIEVRAWEVVQLRSLRITAGRD